MKAKIYVTLKPGVLDPQGKAIHHSVGLLGLKKSRIFGRANILKSRSTRVCSKLKREPRRKKSPKTFWQIR